MWRFTTTLLILLLYVNFCLNQSVVLFFGSQCLYLLDLKWNSVDGFVYMACIPHTNNPVTVLVVDDSYSVSNSIVINYSTPNIYTYAFEMNINPQTGIIYCVDLIQQILIVINSTSVIEIMNLTALAKPAEILGGSLAFDFTRHVFYGVIYNETSYQFILSQFNYSSASNRVLFYDTDSRNDIYNYVGSVLDVASGLVYSTFTASVSPSTCLTYRYNSSNQEFKLLIDYVAPSENIYFSLPVFNSVNELMLTTFNENCVGLSILNFAQNGTLLDSIPIQGGALIESYNPVLDPTTGSLYVGQSIIFQNGLSFSTFPNSFPIGYFNGLFTVNLWTKIVYAVCDYYTSLCVSSCVPGSYHAQQSSSCAYCPASFYCPSANQSDITACPPGYYCPLASFQPYLCPIGFWCSSLSSEPLLCQPGFFCPEGSAQMLNCTAGSFCSISELGAPNGVCASAQYCPIGSILPSICPSGAYCPFINMFQPVLCSIGTYCPLIGSFNPGFACPSGSFCDTVGLSYPSGPCPAQFYCPLGTVFPRLCPSGFTSVVGSSDCFACPAGFVTSNATCVPCPSGYAALNTSVCVPCPAGSYCPFASLLSNAVSCNSSKSLYCPALSETPQIVADGFVVHQNSLILCPAGFLCTAGIPIPCAAGTFNSIAGSQQCIDCPLGFYAPSLNFTSCLSCESGYYTLSNGSVNCIPCPTGSYSPSHNASFCMTCEPGTYAPSFGSTVCMPCLGNTFASVSSSLACSSCPQGTVANVNHSACSSPNCLPGYQYSSSSLGGCEPCGVNSYSSGYGDICHSCGANTYAAIEASIRCLDCSELTGIECSPTYGATVSLNYWGYLVLNKKGVPNVYNISLGSIEIRAALCPENLCLGGNGLVASSAVEFLVDSCDRVECPLESAYVGVSASPVFCASNHWNDVSNNLCGQCETDTIEWNGACVKCDSIQIGVLFGFLLLSFVYLAFIYYISQTARSDGKILLYFVQTALYQFGSYNQYIQWLGFSNFSLFESSGATCLAPLNAYQTFELSVALPLIFLGELFVIMVFHYLFQQQDSWKCMKRKEAKAAADVFRIDTREFLFHKYFRAFLSLLCFAYLQISEHCINYLNCVYVNGTYVMFSSPSIDCTSDNYRSLLPVVIFFIVSVVCFFPICIGLLMYCYRDRLSDPIVKAHLGNLYESYHSKASFWQVWVLIRQVVMIVLFNLFVTDHSSQFLAFLYFNLAVYGIHSYFSPNLYAHENRLEGCSHILLLIICALLLPSDGPYSEWQQILTCLLLLPFATLLLILVVTLRLCKKNMCFGSWATRSKKRKQEEEELASKSNDCGNDLALVHVTEHRRTFSSNPLAVV